MQTPLVESIYIHIPFCKSKCRYCNFISYTDKNSSIEAYFQSLNKEIALSRRSIQGKKFNTVYIGGGTPSIVDGFYFEQILSGLELSDSAEITIEANPETVSYEYLKNLRAAGVNRISMGVQCFDNRVLKLLNRIHTSKQVISAVNQAKKAGFSNISIDLIYGLPAQTFSGWEKTLYSALELDINHISAYGLKIEEGTGFFHNPPAGLPDDELSARMYLRTIEILEQNGYKHYEISNFARPGFESRHNMAYWKNREYFGFGAGAHGYVDGIRYSNKPGLEDYINNPTEKQAQKQLSQTEIIEEAIFLGLRLRNGINPAEFEKKYCVDIQKKFKTVIEKYIAQELMVVNNNSLKLTPEGILVSNSILADLLLQA